MKTLIFTLLFSSLAHADGLGFQCVEAGINPKVGLYSNGNGLIKQNPGTSDEVVYQIEDVDVITGPADGTVYKYEGVALGLSFPRSGTMEFEFLLSADGSTSSVLTTTTKTLYPEKVKKTHFRCVIPLN